MTPGHGVRKDKGFHKAIAGLACATLLCGTSTAAVRTWTNAQGRTFEASFVRVDGPNVIFAFENGRTFSTPAAELCAADRGMLAMLQRTAPAAPATAEAEKPAALNFGYPWPREIRVDGASQSKVVSEDAKTGRYVYESPNYRFTCDARLTSDVLRNFAMMFETTHKYASSVPLSLGGATRQGRLDILLFESTNGYIQAGGPPRTAGCFIPSTGVVMVPMESLGLSRTPTGFSLDTKKGKNAVLVHELAHQMTPRIYMQSSQNGWFIEGLAEYFAATPYSWGYFQPDPYGNAAMSMATAYGEDRLAGRGLGTKLRPPKLRDFLLMDYRYFAGQNANFNYGFALLLTQYFLHMEGSGKALRMTEYLKGLRAGRQGEESLAPLLGGGSFEKLEAEFAAAWQKKGVEIVFPK